MKAKAPAARGWASEREWQVWLVGAEVRVWLVGAEVHRRWGGECRNSEVIRGRPGEAPVSADRTESSPLVTALQSRCIRTLR